MDYNQALLKLKKLRQQNASTIAQVELLKKEQKAIQQKLETLGVEDISRENLEKISKKIEKELAKYDDIID